MNKRPIAALVLLFSASACTGQPSPNQTGLALAPDSKITPTAETPTVQTVSDCYDGLIRLGLLIVWKLREAQAGSANETAAYPGTNFSSDPAHHSLANSRIGKAVLASDLQGVLYAAGGGSCRTEPDKTGRATLELFNLMNQPSEDKPAHFGQ